MSKPDALERLRILREDRHWTLPVIEACAEVLEEAAKRANIYAAEEALREQATRFRSIVGGEG